MRLGNLARHYRHHVWSEGPPPIVCIRCGKRGDLLLLVMQLTCRTIRC
jgi:hypothetical protein